MIDPSLLEGTIAYRYQLLARLKSDCDIFLYQATPNPKRLWASNEREQIEAMEALWNGFDAGEKPQWLSWEDIQAYKAKLSVVSAPDERAITEPAESPQRPRE